MKPIAYHFDRHHRIVFTRDDLPEDLRRDAEERFGARLQTDVELESPDPISLHRWPEGADRPECVLARSRQDPARYKVFRYRREVPSDFEDLGPNYSVLLDPGQFQTFLETLGRLEELARRNGPGNRPAAWDAFFEELEHGQPAAN